MIEDIRKSLVVKTSLLFLVAAAIPYLLMTIFFFNSSRGAIYGEIVKGLELQTLLIRDNIDARLMLLRGNSIAWADLDVMGDILTDDIDKRIAHVLEGLKTDYRLPGEIHALNREGRIVASSSLESLGKTVMAPWMTEILAGNVAELDLHHSAVLGGSAIAFAAPVKASFGEKGVVGALLLEYRAAALIDPAISDETFHVSIIDSKGEIVASLHEADLFSREVTRLSRADYKTKTSASGHIVAFVPSLGGPPLFAGFGWTIAGAVLEEQALGPVRRIEQTSIVISIAGLALLLILVTIFSRRTVMPLRELSETANRIAETKDFSSSVHSGSSDEVGRLAEAFNGMVGEVKNHIDHISRMEEEMRWADRLSALGELSAGMAHEIKNPLGIIKSSAGILEGRLEKSDQEGLLASAISEEATRLTALLESFLQFARPRPPQNNICQINSIIEKTLLLIGSEISRSKIVLEKSFDYSVPALYTDENQIQQVLINIIINALQAMPEGGTLEVATKLSSFPDNSGNGGEAILITLADTGPGISAEVRDQIFNPFYTTKETGTGLGLSIVFRIISGLGGELKLETGQDGTTFKIYLPLSKEDLNEDDTRS
ncbi:MAG: ATP-binding protein [bacterium]|nr:ATP-binding protein [bacterium]